MNQSNQSKGIYAFIDNQNLNVTVQNLGWKIDWVKFRNFLADRHGVTKAYMFIGYVPEYEEMYEFLHDAGYAIVLKPTFDMTRPQPEESKDKSKEEEKKRPIKGNIDAELVLWAMRERDRYDKAIIVSGDGDFYSLVEYLEGRQKLAKILTPSGHYSNLYNKYEKYIERLDHSRKLLEYRPKKRFVNRGNNENNGQKP